LAIGFPDWGNKSDVLFWLAEAEYRTGNTSQARIILRRLVARGAPRERIDQVYYTLGWCYYDDGDYREALRVFKSFSQRFPDSPYRSDALYRQGHCLYNLGELEEAITVYRALVTSYPRSPRAGDARFQIGWCLYRLERFVEAAALFDQLLAGGSLPDEMVPRATLWRAYALFRSGRYGEAREGLRWLRASGQCSDSLQAEIDLLVSDSYFNEGALESAVESYRSVVLRTSPASAVQRAYQGLWWGLFQLDRYEEANQAARELFQRYPRSSAALAASWQLGEVSLRRGEPARATEWFNRFAEVSSSRDSVCLAFLRVGQTLIEKEQYSEAYESLGKAMPCTGRIGHEAHYLRGVCNFRAGVYPEAIRDWEPAVQHPEGNPWAARSVFRSAEAYRALGEKESALALFTRVTEQFGPDSVLTGRAYVSMALLVSAEDPSSAVSYLNAALEHGDAETRGRARVELGLVLAEQGQLEEALEQFIKATMSGFDEYMVRGLYGKAEIYERQNEWGRALETYRDIVQLKQGRLSDDAVARIAWIESNRWLLESEQTGEEKSPEDR
jgi:TolA-binding protein